MHVPVPGILLLFGWYQYGKNLVKKKYSNQYQKNLVPEKVPVSVPEQFGTGTGKFPGIFLFLGGTDIGTGTNWSRKSTGTGNRNIWSRKKVTVPEKIGYGKKYRYRKNFWVPSHSALSPA